MGSLTDDQPWCHTCELPLDEEHTLRPPAYRIGDNEVVELVCSRCLTGPDDDTQQQEAA